MLLCLSASRIYNTLAMKSTADFKMFFLEGTELFFPDILFDTAFLINFICRPRMMTWLRENWRLYHIRCEIRSEINGIGNVASYWVSSCDSWLLLSYLGWILRGFFGCWDSATRYETSIFKVFLTKVIIFFFNKNTLQKWTNGKWC